MSEDYDPMILVAANRSTVALKDGRVGTLVFWATETDRATVVISGRHERVQKNDVISVVLA